MLSQYIQEFCSALANSILLCSSANIFTWQVAEHQRRSWLHMCIVLLTWQSLGQQGPWHDLVSFSVGHGVPLHEGWVVIVRLRARLPVFSHAALQLPQDDQGLTTQFTGQHLNKSKGSSLLSCLLFVFCYFYAQAMYLRPVRANG